MFFSIIFGNGHKSQVELLNPLNGDVHVSIKTSETGAVGHIPEDDLVVGLHMFKTERMESSSK